MLIRKLILSLLIFSLFAWSCKSSSGLQKKENLPRVENVRFTQEQDMVTVFYDLLARSDKSNFDVELLLAINDEEAYTIDSPSLSGDVGKNVSPGKNQQIKWNVFRDFPRGIQGENIRFIVNAQKMDNSNKTWLYVTLSTLAVGAGVALAVFLGGGEGGGEGGLPGPPGRPGMQ